ncbi:Peptide deformylase [Candidatus Johnevansia muelleri]|uniref:Peptide deformylase n=1 Tax=Candidatus Johnevansia muelleri TaxID=1495769 RepID=A0A078KEJ5_9GAMM|nr:Peptide deformylase [Candidatus Evansia muelleri]
MSNSEIIKYPNYNLRKFGKSVKNIDNEIQILLEKMLNIMYTEKGIGLAANQINKILRIIIINISKNPILLINPIYYIIDDECEFTPEGCLSIPDYYAAIPRALKIWAYGIGKNSENIEIMNEGIIARCIQHEIDHIDGKIFIDYLSSFKREYIKKKLHKRKNLH